MLELGCGIGLDTAWLQDTGCALASTDRSLERLAQNKRKHQDCCFVRLDHTRSLPFPDGMFSIVVSGLSLHYFDEQTTRSIAGEIDRILMPQGKLLARLNSTDDLNFGAASGVETEPGYFEIKYKEGFNHKRFFDEEGVRELFSQFHLEHLVETTFNYHGKPKVAWELVAGKKEK